MTVKPSSLLAFVEALDGPSGEMDAWLETATEDEVRAHVRAYAAGCQSGAFSPEGGAAAATPAIPARPALAPGASVQEQLAYAREALAPHLAEAARELLQWRATGVLPGGRVRELADRLDGFGDDTLRMIEREVEIAALRRAAGLG